METNQEHLLGELETHLVVASTGKRFLNYFIDSFLVFIILVIGMFVYYFTNPTSIDALDEQDNGSILDTIIYTIIYGILMGLYEWIFKGRTLGKLITGTKAVNEDGTTINFKTALLRGIIRCVPFEAFTAFGTRMWHDEWSNTYVIDIKESHIIENK